MPSPTTTDNEFIALFDSVGATKTAQILGVLERNVYARRRRLENKYGTTISAPTTIVAPRKEYPHRQRLDLLDGTVLIASDLHIWPGDASTCLRALKKFCLDIKPDAIILNGDVMDFPKISRHPQN